METPLKSQKGFSLIELLVVVAILLVIAAIALPALANSMRASRESAAVNTLRSMNTAEESFKGTWGAYSTLAKNMGGDPTTCATGAVTATAACDISDKVFADNADAGTVKSNYKFTRSQPTANITFYWVATPADASLLNGRREFCVVQGGVVHATAPGTIGVIDATDPTTCTALPTI